MPPTKLKDNLKARLDAVIGYANSMVGSTRRRVPPNIKAFWYKVRRECADIKSSRKMGKKERDLRVNDDQTDLDRAIARYDQLHAKDLLLEQLVNCFDHLIEYRLHQDYGDYLARDINVPKAAPSRKRELKDLLSAKTKIPWTEISDCIEAEQDAIDIYKYNRRLDTAEYPDTPWLNDIDKGAAAIGTTLDQLVSEIHTYLGRSRTRYNRVVNLIVEKDYMAVSRTILRDLEDLKAKYPGEMPEEKLRMQHAIETLRDRYFEKCNYNKVYRIVILRAAM